MRVSGDYLILSWHDKERRGNVYEKSMDYNDVTTPSEASATDLMNEIESWLVTGVYSDGRTIDGDGTLGNELEVMYYDEIWSAGSLTGFGISDNGDGTVDIAAGTGVLRDAADQAATIYPVSIGVTTALALTDNSENYIFIDYNGGTPQVGVTTSVTGFNCMDKCIIYKLVRQGTVLQWLFAGENNVDANRKLRRKFYETQSILRGTATAVASATGRYVLVTEGIFWFALTRITTAAIDTSGADTFVQVYDTGGGTFSKTSQTQINNSQYNTGGALAAMTGNKYRADDIYMLLDTPEVLYVVIGTAQYNSYTNALTSPKIAAIPLELRHLGIRIARSVILNGATSAVINEISTDEMVSAGDVVGIGGSVDGNFALYSGTSGKYINDLSYSPASFQPAATGTPDGTKYLRDDNSWQPVASGGLTSPQVLARTLGS